MPIERPSHLRFTGDVRAMPEGTLFFAGEPVLEVTAPLLEAQLVETVLLNQVHVQSLLASKAARCVDAADGRRLVDFSLRRTHGGEAGLKAARASYLAGFDATSNVLAGRLFGIPLAGTMAHSYVECFPDEVEAFTAFMRAYRRAACCSSTRTTPSRALGAPQTSPELPRRKAAASPASVWTPATF